MTTGKFKVDQDEIDVNQLLYNLDRKRESYIRSKNLNAEQQQAFNDSYNKIREGIASGTISGRNSDRSYATEDFQNATEGYDSVGEVFHYVDQLLDNRKRGSSSGSGSSSGKKKYTKGHILNAFVNKMFGGNSELDMKAWEEDDYDSATGTYKTDNRRKAMTDFLTKYKEGLDDYDFTDSQFESVDDLRTRLDNAIVALQGDDFHRELGALGFGEAFRSNMFRTKNELYKGEQEIPLPEGSETWSDEQKKAYRERVKREGSVAGQQAYDKAMGYLDQAEENRQWEAFLKNSSQYAPETKKNTITYDRTQGFWDIGENNNDVHVRDMANFYKNLGMKTSNARDLYSKDLIEYMSGNNTDDSYWNDKLNTFYKNTGQYHWYASNPSISKHFVDTYNAFVQQELDSGSQNLVNGTKLGLGENEYYVRGMWDPDKFVFYTYDSNGGINTHRIDESQEMLDEWRKAGYFKKTLNPAKKQDGGIIFNQAPKSDGLTDRQRVGLDKEHNREQAGKRVVSEDLRPEDYARFGAMAADVGALVASFAPGYGTAASGILSLGSTAADLTADIMDKSVSAGQVMTNLGANLGMAVLGLIPGGKSAGIASKIAKWTPKIIAAATAANLALNDDIHKSLGKLTSDEKLTVNDWKNIGIALSSVSGLTRSGKAAYQARKFKAEAPSGDVKVSVKGIEGDVTLTKEELANLGKAKSNKEATDYLLSLKKEQVKGRPKGEDGKEIDFDFGIKEGRTWDNLWGLRRGFNVETKPGDSKSINAERIAMEKARIEHANQADDSTWWSRMTTGDKRLATDYEMYQGSLPIKGIELPDTGLTRWFRDLVKDSFAEEYKAKQKAKAQVDAARKSTSQEWLNEGRAKNKANAEAEVKAKKDAEELLKQRKEASAAWVKEARQQAKAKKDVEHVEKYGETYEKAGEVAEMFRKLHNIDPAFREARTPLMLNSPRYFRLIDKGMQRNDLMELGIYKEGGVLKEQQGGVTTRKPVRGNSTITNNTIVDMSKVSDSKPIRVANALEDLRLLRTIQHNDRMAGKAIQGLRDAYIEPGVAPQKSLRVQANQNLAAPYRQAAAKTQNVVNQNLTSDATSNALLQLSAQSQINDYNIQGDTAVAGNLEVQKEAALKQQHAALDAEHVVAELRKEKRGALSKAISDIQIGADAANHSAIDKGMQGEITTQKQKQLAAENQMYANEDANQRLMMQDELNRLKNLWLQNPENKPEMWLESKEYQEAYGDLYRNYLNNMRKYKSNYYGIEYNPVYAPFDPTGLKKGGKVDREHKKRVETAKIVNKKLLEEIKHGDKKLDRFSKVTQKAIIKALGL